MDGELTRRLCRLEAEGLRRALLTVDSPAGEVRVEGQDRPVINLASNDYLGLAGHPALAEATARAAHELGCGAGASRLISGSLAVHAELEQTLAELLGVEQTLLFGSGYLCHLGTIPALAQGEQDVIYSDQLNHASIVDGCRLARARVRTYSHADAAELERLLAADTDLGGGGGRRLVVTESVFSMDGDEAPLRQICELARRFEAWVLVDEAHAFGVRGRRGAGLVEELGLGQGVHIRMGTLGKAAGSYGAFVGGSKTMTEYLINRSRSFIYSTALPPTVAAASLAAVQLLGGEEGERRRQALDRAAQSLRQGLTGQGWRLGQGRGAILPVVIGDPHRAVALAEALLERGVLARAMRHPTVPRGTERLRLVASAALEGELVERALGAFGELV